MGGPTSTGSTSSSSRTKESDKNPGTFFLGRYRVVDEIGVGGMASVHLARMDGPGGFQKWVAIKRIHPHLVEDDQFVDMFLDEARIAAGINHANVAQVFDLGKDDNTYWIAMEYLHGEPLREVMRRAEERGLQLAPELAARMCADAAEGLHAAHELRGKNGQLLGLVHRDVTPHNLFITYDGYTKVVDFGIAKVADRLSSTRAGTLKGKLAYMSPEQVSGVKDIDRTTDIFALGVVLWELTTNQRLFRMDTDLDTLEKVQKCEVPRPSSIVPNYPLELEAIVLKALAKDRNQRFATAREFSRALQNFLMRMGAYVGPEEVAQFVRQVFADRIQKREQHLAWAAEVTSTINVDQLKGLAPGSGGGSGGGHTGHTGHSSHGADDDDDLRRPRGNAPRSTGSPASGIGPIGRGAQVESQMAASSLMDDDEDVPTTVANRDQIEPRSAGPDRLGPRPAAGMPAPNHGMGGPPPGMGGPRPMHTQPTGGGPPGGAARPAAATIQFPMTAGPAPGPYGGRPPGSPYSQPPPPYPQSALDERDDDLGATLALPSNAAMPSASQGDRGRPNFGPPPGAQTGMQGPSFGAPPYGNGQGYGSPQASQTGFPATRPGGAPTFGPAPGGLPPNGLQPPMAPGYPMQYPPGQGPQSQIETALSLPRPDPTALWMAQQDAAKRGQRRNTGVIIAVVALTALCLIGIIALVYFKMQKQAPPPSVSAATSANAAVPQAPTVPVAAAVPAPAPAPSPAAEPQPAAGATTAAASPAAPAAAAAAPAAPAVSTNRTAAVAPTPAAATTSEPKEAPGFLTVHCDPQCDEVLDNGRSLGASPVLRASAAPGQHRITGRKGSTKKVISVIVVSGSVTAQRISMK
ncbi:serine/threonine protein kinase [Chondromyces apiculatus]|uniref:Serine/threonine protein kinase n=1 Tax=Chondromyces apiculatus DSM 436 TaxID=1192034 RepID=A0A017T5B8_9BACT|nr:serine/threonine-protein kinase [Chondromyces apiculatus]EYF04429.1 serine/threonine protein kinase [Chondromyces apiculatus DSM 436]